MERSLEHRMVKSGWVLKLLTILAAFLGFLPVSNPFGSIQKFKFHFISVVTLASLFQLVYPVLYISYALKVLASEPAAQPHGKVHEFYTGTGCLLFRRSYSPRLYSQLGKNDQIDAARNGSEKLDGLRGFSGAKEQVDKVGLSVCLHFLGSDFSCKGDGQSSD